MTGVTGLLPGLQGVSCWPIGKLPLPLTSVTIVVVIRFVTVVVYSVLLACIAATRGGLDPATLSTVLLAATVGL